MVTKLTPRWKTRLADRLDIHREVGILSAALSPAGDAGEAPIALHRVEKTLAIDLLLDRITAAASRELRSDGCAI